ncbi:MAG TPA: fasciclin domain-containing protein, partial [Gemmatimonadales bacterium]|nr:fasciclin domain-containing protein [Gemmatimonadales bacterium]
AAFAKLGDETIQALLKDKAKLAAILQYHVVSGEVLAADVVQLSSAKTLNGAAVNISVNGGVVKVNDSVVTATDIKARNGVIHVIDTVLLPPAN